MLERSAWSAARLHVIAPMTVGPMLLRDGLSRIERRGLLAELRK
jgi:hypothetical protein